jgi:choline transport protein
VAVLQSILGASLAEFISSYPTEGAMYHWIGAIAPRRATGFLSFVTGWLTVAGCMYIPLDLLIVLIVSSRDLHYCLYEPNLCSEFYGSYCSIS